MRLVFIHSALMAGGAFALAGCGIADSRAPVPEFMRIKATEPAPEPPPEVKRLVREKMDAVFTAASYPRHVQVSAPRRDPRGGLDWTACVKADLTSVNGKPLGAQTYRVTISAGAIIDRRRAEDGDNCASESFEPI
jgi:hypothetical protein